MAKLELKQVYADIPNVSDQSARRLIEYLLDRVVTLQRQVNEYERRMSAVETMITDMSAVNDKLSEGEYEAMNDFKKASQLGIDSAVKGRIKDKSSDVSGYQVPDTFNDLPF